MRAYNRGIEVFAWNLSGGWAKAACLRLVQDVNVSTFLFASNNGVAYELNESDNYR